MASTSRFKHPVYLSEEEVCVQILPFLESHYGKGNVYPELAIASIRPDFVIFKKDVIEIVEVKLHADFDSVRQITFYHKVVFAHIYNLYFEYGQDLNLPKIETRIIAKSFDTNIDDILDIAAIAKQRFTILDDKTIDIDSCEMWRPDQFKIDNKFLNQILENCKRGNH